MLGDWAKQYAKKPAEEVSVPLYVAILLTTYTLVLTRCTHRFLGIYSALLVAATLADLAARTMHMVGSLQACTIIHKQLIEAVLGTTLRYAQVLRPHRPCRLTGHVADGLRRRPHRASSLAALKTSATVSHSHFSVVSGCASRLTYDQSTIRWSKVSSRSCSGRHSWSCD